MTPIRILFRTSLSLLLATPALLRAQSDNIRFCSSDSLDSQRFGQSLASQRFGGFRDSGAVAGRGFGGGGFRGRR